MPNVLLYDPIIWSYGFAALIFAAFAARLLLSWRGGLRASVAFGAAIASTLWAGFVIAALAFPISELWRAARFFDALRIGAWLAFLLLLLGEWRDLSAAIRQLRLRPWRVVGAAILLIAATAKH